MRIPSVVVLIVLSILFSCDTEDSVDKRFENYFIKYYGEEGDQFGIDLKKTENGFVIVGRSTSTQQDVSQIFVVLTDEVGNPEPIIYYSTSGTATPSAIERDNDGNFVIAATVEVGPDDTDIMILKINAQGQEINREFFGHEGELDAANRLTITSQGDYIVTGYTTNIDKSKPDYIASTDLEDIYSIRTTSDLVEYPLADWRRVYGFSGIDRGVEIIEKADGTFLIFGTTNKAATSNSQQSGYNMFMFPAGPDGIAISTTEFQLFGTLSDERAQRIIQTSEGGFAMLGTSTAEGGSLPFMASIRTNGDYVSSGIIPVEDNFVSSSFLELADNGFVVIGKQVVSGKDSNIMLTKIAANGSIGWSKLFGGLEIDEAGTVIELDDGSIAFVGTVTLGSQSKACLIKVTSDGELKP